jgi:drug/metabolite transporter (DMT)-like permease
MNHSLGYWLAVAAGLIVGGGTILANQLMRLDPGLLALAVVIVVASCIYLIVERRFSK